MPFLLFVPLTFYVLRKLVICPVEFSTPVFYWFQIYGVIKHVPYIFYKLVVRVEDLT
jgi:hypothetical protein